MKLFLDRGTTRQLAVLLRKIPETLEHVSAAIAYTQDETLVKLCVEKGLSLEWWGLFDSELSTKYSIIRKAISSPRIRFYPFADFFHPKVIWFHGMGVYIGSHNMTISALNHNVEAGVFLDESDLSAAEREQLVGFFDYLRDHSLLATAEDLDRLDEFERLTRDDNEKQDELRHRAIELFEEHFAHLFTLKAGVTDFETSNVDRDNKRRLLFLREWREAQKYLAHIQKKLLAECTQPRWIAAHADPTIITDQLLHAYYYTYLLKGSEDRKSVDVVHAEYDKNRRNPDAALRVAMQWWESLTEAPATEADHINLWGPSNKAILGQLRERDLTQVELEKVLTQNHAVRNHARQIKNEFLKLPNDFKTDIAERVTLYARWLNSQKTARGLTVHTVLRFLLFDDQISVEERVYETISNPKYRLEHFGRSIVGELIGWGRPDITHLRNNRVNKALRCLGFDVRLFSE